MTEQTESHGVKLRSGHAPEYVARFADVCPCGNAVQEGQWAVWFAYAYHYTQPTRCGECQRFKALGGCYYHRWERILREADVTRREALKALGDSPKYAGARLLVEAEYVADAHEAKVKMAKAKTHYKAYHLGCQVGEVLKDPDLRVRVIRLMRKRLNARMVPSRPRPASV